MSVTAIFGGTFNPLHIGHYEMLAALQRDEDIEEIWLMPDRIPPHKICDFIAEDDVRIEMCRIAAKDFPKARLCLIEFEREGKSYTYDTVLYLKERYPERDFAFVLGGDMLVYFDKWYKANELMKLLSFIAFRRTDDSVPLFDSCVKRFSDMGMKITVKNDIIPEVSSSQIRTDFGCAESLLPPKIYSFLSERGDYNGKN